MLRPYNKYDDPEMIYEEIKFRGTKCLFLMCQRVKKSALPKNAYAYYLSKRSTGEYPDCEMFLSVHPKKCFSMIICYKDLGFNVYPTVTKKDIKHLNTFIHGNDVDKWLDNSGSL